MKCINKLRMGCIFTCFILSVSITGCGSNSLQSAYQLDSDISAFEIQESAGLSGQVKADGFAKNLCLRDERTLDGSQVDLSESLSGVLCDLNGNRIIYGKDENMQLPPASLTKVMTALLALENASLDTELTASENVKITESGATLCGLEYGDKMNMDQALHALLMESANDAAIMIAENIGGSVEGFAEMMNQKAASIGATNCHFVNPHGLTADDHYVTAYDMYLIFKEAMKYDEFKQIIHQDSYETIYYDAQGNGKEYTCETTNLFLKGDYAEPDGVTVIGGKTGTTNAARSCLVLLSQDRAGRPYVSVILNCSERGILYQEMAGLLSNIQ